MTNHTAWNKGLKGVYHASEETKRKMSEAHKGKSTTWSIGKIPWNKGLKGIHQSPATEFKKGNVSAFKGKTYVEIYGIERAKGIKELMSNKRKGTHISPNTEFKSGTIPWNEGMKNLIFVGEKNPFWKGTEAKYGTKHDWVERHLGKPQKCENCGTDSAKRFHWHNISSEYKREISDWKRLCAKCHKTVHKKEKK